MNPLKTKYTIHVEVCIKTSSASCLNVIESSLKDCLTAYLNEKKLLIFNKTISLNESAVEFDELLAHVETIMQEYETDNITTISGLTNGLLELDYIFHFYVMNTRAMEMEMLDMNDGGDMCGGVSAGDGADIIPSCNHWILPSKHFDTMWEHLYYDDNIKMKLLEFSLSALKLARYQINPNIITCNRLILLYGPPGTGKTSLCKALAQKLAIRTCSIYTTQAHFIEINAHSLFSKWFSESGKLVFKMFAKIREIVMDPNNLVCILIDEIESLAYERQSMVGGMEPKDSMRVVNALLTQLDSLREYPNVLTLATSNLMQAIDRAFMDRVDIKQYIDLPSMFIIDKMYQTMLRELKNSGIINCLNMEINKNEEENGNGNVNVNENNILYRKLSEMSTGLSGRAIRKLPYRAYALCCIANNEYSHFLNDGKITFNQFYKMLLLAIKETHNENKPKINSVT